jgi:hypothetical protein
MLTLIFAAIASPPHRPNGYVRSFAAVFLGYHGVYVVDDLREQYKRLFSKAARRSGGNKELSDERHVHEGTRDAKRIADDGGGGVSSVPGLWLEGARLPR